MAHDDRHVSMAPKLQVWIRFVHFSAQYTLFEQGLIAQTKQQYLYFSTQQVLELSKSFS
jgi:hypothetical protein